MLLSNTVVAIFYELLLLICFTILIFFIIFRKLLTPPFHFQILDSSLIVFNEQVSTVLVVHPNSSLNETADDTN